MGQGKWTSAIGFCALFSIALAGRAAAQVPWDVFADPDSSSVCDVVNTANVQLVVLSDTGELVIVSGTDVILGNTFVADDLTVFFDGAPVGLIDFAADADGFRSLWWLTFAGTVVEVDTLTGEPADSGEFPDSFANVPCDACEFWDDPVDCGGVVIDADGDGVDDAIDDCPDTPLDEVADDGGCSCSQLDEDLDGVSDCDDECPGTPLDFIVDDFGCEIIIIIDDDGDGVDDAIDDCPNTPPDEVADDGGCSCSELDEDDDGVVDCDDECPGTPSNLAVDDTGCGIDGGVPIFVSCGGVQALMFSFMLAGLVGLKLVSRRGI